MVDSAPATRKKSSTKASTFCSASAAAADSADRMRAPSIQRAILERNKPDLVLVDRKYEHSVQVMADEAAKAAPQWTLIYQDGICQLWGRKSVYADPESKEYIAPEERLITDIVHQTAFSWPALPIPSPTRTVAERDAAAPRSNSL